MPHELPTEMVRECTDGLLYCFSQWANDVTIGAFWVFALLAFSISIMLASMRYGWSRAFGFGGFVGMIGAIFLAILTLIPWWIASVFIIVGVISLAGLFVKKQ